MSLWVFVVIISFLITGFLEGSVWLKTTGGPSQGPWNFIADAHVSSTLH